MNRFITYYTRYVHFMMVRKSLRYAGWVLVLLLALPLANIEVQNSLDEWMPDNAEIMQNRHQFMEDFGHDEWMFLYLVFPDDMAPHQQLRLMEQTTKHLERINGLDQVFTRNHLRELTSLAGLPQNAESFSAVEDMYFTGHNPRGEMIYLRQRKSDNPDGVRPAILESIEMQIAFLPENVTRHITGSGVIFTEIDRLTNEDAALMVGGAVLLMILLLAFRSGSRRRFFLIGSLLVMTYLPALSVFGWLGTGVNMITMVVPVLLLILFVANLLHVTTHTELPIEEYISSKVVPVSLAALTTIIGIGSLVTSEFPIIRDFGLSAAVCLAAGLGILLILGIPEILARKYEASEAEKPARFDSFLTTTLTRYYAALSKKMAAGITFSALLIAAAGIYVFPGIEVDTNSLVFLNEENTVRQDVGFIEESFGNFNPVDVVLSKQSDTWQGEDWDNINLLREDIEALPFVDGMIGFDTWHAAENPAATEQMRPEFVSDDGKRTRLMVRIPLASAGEMERYHHQIMDVVGEFADQNHYEAHTAGYLPVYLYQMNNIVSGMLTSLSLALVLIMLVVFLVVRQWKLGLLSLFPNIFPLLGLALIMYLAGIPLDISTSVIACVVIGIVVDDCLHILWYYKRGHDEKIRPAGEIFTTHVIPYIRPITNSTLIFGIGFLVMTFSQVVSIVYMGLLCSLGLFIAWIADVLLFPTLIRLFD